MDLVTDHRSITAIRWDDPCVQAFRLAETGSKRALEDQLREAQARAAREIGWAPRASTDEEALRSLRGRTGRRRLLDRAVYIHSVDWKAEAAAKDEIQLAADWVAHLRSDGITTVEDLARHLEEDLRIMEVKPKKIRDRVERAVRRLGPQFSRESRRSPSAWGREALRLLWWVRADTVKRGALRGRQPRAVYLVKTDITELDLLRDAWRLRQQYMSEGRMAVRRVQREAKAQGLTTDEYLRERVGQVVE